MAKKITSIQTKVKTYSIDRPAEMVVVAKVIKDYIIKNNLSVKIMGHDYVLVEGWQFGGGLMGLLPRIVRVEKLADMKWLAQAEIINTKTKEVIGTGYAICSKEEVKKKTFDEYAILSMAQTRAIGKAYRNLIGWVIKMAGFEATPAEEMKQEMVITSKQPETQKITIEETVKGIRNSNNKVALVKAMGGITASKNYTAIQKNLLLKTINERIEELKK